jgi:signal peptidase I
MNSKQLILIFFVVSLITISGSTESYAFENNDGFSWELKVVVSNSMQPEISRGDLVIVTTNTGEINVGDIVIYNATWYQLPIIHRVISIKNSNGSKLYEIKGDSNPVPDPELVSQEKIMAKVVKINHNYLIIPEVGYFFLWLMGE